MKKKPVTHVSYITGKTWCGAKRAKSVPFDADACPKCRKLVTTSLEKKDKADA